MCRWQPGKTHESRPIVQDFIHWEWCCNATRPPRAERGRERAPKAARHLVSRRLTRVLFRLANIPFSCSLLFASTDLCAETFRARNHQKIRSTCKSGHLGPLGHPSFRRLAWPQGPAEVSAGLLGVFLRARARACANDQTSLAGRNRRGDERSPPLQNTRINIYAVYNMRVHILSLSHRPPLHI